MVPWTEPRRCSKTNTVSSIELRPPCNILHWCSWWAFSPVFSVSTSWAPVLTELTAGAKTLPLPTQLLMKLVELVRNPAAVGFVLLLGLLNILALSRWLRHPRGRALKDAFLLALPIIVANYGGGRPQDWEKVSLNWMANPVRGGKPEHLKIHYYRNSRLNLVVDVKRKYLGRG